MCISVKACLLKYKLLFMKDKDLRQRQNIYNINSLPDIIVVGDFKIGTYSNWEFVRNPSSWVLSRPVESEILTVGPSNVLTIPLGESVAVC